MIEAKDDDLIPDDLEIDTGTNDADAAEHQSLSDDVQPMDDGQLIDDARGGDA